MTCARSPPGLEQRHLDARCFELGPTPPAVGRRGRDELARGVAPAEPPSRVERDTPECALLRCYGDPFSAKPIRSPLPQDRFDPRTRPRPVQPCLGADNLGYLCRRISFLSLCQSPATRR